MAPETKICLLLSGGIESSVLLEKALNQGFLVHPLYLKSGLLWENAERYWIKKLLRHFSQTSLKPLKEVSFSLKFFFPENWGFHPDLVPKRKSPSSSIFIPARNLTLLSHALLVCHSLGLQEIWLGSLRTNSFQDASKEFFKDFEKIGKKTLSHNIKIQTPLIRFKKRQVLVSNPSFPYKLTFSCLSPKGKLHCGDCFKCISRKKNFIRAGIKDPTKYFLT